MSGIIGGAGSKSGVIGTTELEYEEGTFAVQFATTGTAYTTCTMDSGADQGAYCRVGNIVTFNCDAAMSVLTVGSASGDLVLYSLPFAINSTISGDGPTAGGGLGRVVNEAIGAPTGWYGTAGSATIRFGYRNTNGYWYVAAHTGLTASFAMWFGGSYICIN